MDKIYQRIGEFVVCFQWLEDLIRQIGWLVIDPGVPPLTLTFTKPLLLL
jgi:hypothetical protein